MATRLTKTAKGSNVFLCIAKRYLCPLETLLTGSVICAPAPALDHCCCNGPVLDLPSACMCPPTAQTHTAPHTQCCNFSSQRLLAIGANGSLNQTRSRCSWQTNKSFALAAFAWSRLPQRLRPFFIIVFLPILLLETFLTKYAMVTLKLQCFSFIFKINNSWIQRNII